MGRLSTCAPGRLYEDKAHAPAKAGTLTFYDSGTTDLRTTYSDAALSAANANPITLNSEGRLDVEVFGAGLFTVLLKDSSGGTVWSEDDILAEATQSKTFTANDATPSVLGVRIGTTANTSATNITDFDDGFVGQELLVIINDAFTTIDFRQLLLRSTGFGIIRWSPDSGDSMKCVYDGTVWWCTPSVMDLDKKRKGKSVDESQTDTTLTDDGEMKGYELKANSFYALTGYLKVTSTSSTPDLKMTFSVDNAFRKGTYSYLNINEDATVTQDSTTITTSVAVAVVANKTHSVTITGFCQTHVSLDSVCDFRWSQNSADAAAITLEKGSWIKFDRTRFP